jgi:hypothetical protein
METPGTKRSLWKLSALLAPFVWAAVASNLFLVALLFPHLGVPVLSPVATLLWSLPITIPAAWVSALWVRRLLAEGER